MKNLSNFLFSGILAVLPNPSQWREVRNLEILVSFLVSVLAGIVTYYICNGWTTMTRSKTHGSQPGVN